MAAAAYSAKLNCQFIGTPIPNAASPTYANAVLHRRVAIIAGESTLIAVSPRGCYSKSMFYSIKLIFIGIALGIANVIPGVSGGTIAVVFNVYDRLLAVITPSVRKIFAQWKFWLPLGAGVVVGILFFAKLTSFLFARYSAPTSCFFLGLIAGSIPLVYRKMRAGKASGLPPLSSIFFAACAFALMVFMFLARPEADSQTAQSVSPAFAVFLLGAGILAAVAMIIPGISGSFLLLALGVYTTVIGAAGSLVDCGFGFLRGTLSFNAAVSAAKMPVFIIAPVLAGIIIGLFCGAALVRFLLRHVPRQTYGAIFGLVAGSLLVVFPSINAFSNFYMIGASIVCFVFGAAITLFIDRPKARQ